MTNNTNNKNAIKCPICGGGEFVSMSEPINDQYARINGECYVCTDCGYVFWFNKGYVQFVKDRKESITKLDKEIALLYKQKDELAKDIHNVDAYKVTLEEHKKELNQRIAWGETGSKKCRALEQSIYRLQMFIDSGVNADVDEMIQRVNNKIHELKNHRDEIARPLRLTKLYN